MWFRDFKLELSPLSLFGLLSVTAMLICYALEEKHRFFTLGFAIACAMGSAYGFLQGAWPFGFVEGVWAIVALRKFLLRSSIQQIEGR